MDDRFYIPRTLDDPPLFFLWAFDEASLFIACALLGGMLGKELAILGVVMGWVAARGLARIKQQGGRGLLVRVLYWYIPSEWWFPTLTPSWAREYLGG